MSHAQCCCVNTATPCIVSTDPNDWPACVSIDISGVQALAYCEIASGFESASLLAFSGVNRTIVANQSTTAGLYLATAECYVVYKLETSAGVWHHIYTTVGIDIELQCDNGRFVVFRVGVTLYGRQTDHPTWTPLFIVYDYNDFGLVLHAEFGDIATNELSAACYGFTALGHVIGGGDVVVTQPGTCAPLPYLVEAVECNGSGAIVVDLADNPDDQPGPSLPVLGGVTYVPTGTVVSGPKTPGVVWLDVQCSQPSNLFARKCSDSSVTIAFDPALQTPGGVTLVHLGESYLPTNEPTNQPDAGGVWSTSPCPGAAKVARNCSNVADEISYDQSLKPVGGLTMMWNSERYYPTTADSNQPPVPAVWSTLGCFSDRPFINPCFDLSCQPGSPNFPLCCSLSIYAQCVQCAGQLMFNGNQSSQRRRKATGLRGIKSKIKRPFRKKGLVSEAELDAMGADPAIEAARAKQGGCCGQPMIVD